SSRRRHTRFSRDWSSDVCSSDLDFKEAKELIAVEEGPEAEATKQNRLMIIELLEAYTWHQLVDIFGMVPYTEALNIENVYPKYDDGAFIYNDLLKRVTDAVEALDPSEGSFGSADLYYGGDVEKIGRAHV